MLGPVVTPGLLRKLAPAILRGVLTWSVFVCVCSGKGFLLAQEPENASVAPPSLTERSSGDKEARRTLERLGTTLTRPAFLDWSGARREFAHGFPIPRTAIPANVRLLSRSIPDPEHWAAAQQMWLATAASCPCLAESPGLVPDGHSSPGPPLRLGKNGSVAFDLDLSWGSSCATAPDYSVHEGQLGGWYSHVAVACTTAGATFVTVTPGSGSRYYLVVPLSEEAEGGYGVDSGGDSRPRSSWACRPVGYASSCP